MAEPVLCDSSYLIASVLHGAIELAHPVSFHVREEVSFLPIRAGVVLGPGCRPIVALDLAAVVACLDLDDDIAAGTKASLVITLQQSDGGSTVITCANMKRGSSAWEGDAAPYQRAVDFAVEDTMASSPLSITV